jgi:peptidoglycan/LPS O-acetylase OafA/YrhL
MLSSIQTLPSTWAGRAIAALARWSYALYLTNSLLMSAARSMFSELLESSAFWDWLMMPAILVTSLTVSAALHRWFEKPIMELRGRQVQPMAHAA